jgi:hypothetical protein
VPPIRRRYALFAAFGTPFILSASASAAARTSAPVKCTEFIRRAPGLAREAFLATWLERRAPLFARLPRLKGLVFNLVDRARSPNATYDAAIEFWFESADAYAAAVNDAPPEILSALAAGARDFMQVDVMALFTREVAVRTLAPGRAAPRAKRIGLVGRRPDTPQAEFFRDWADVHAPPVDRQPGLERYVLNLLARDRALDAPWDGYAELWWTDWDAYEAARAAIGNDLGRRLDFFHSHELLLVDEYIAIDPPRESR